MVLPNPKNLKIKHTRAETKERHKHMHCRVFEIKVDFSKLSREKKEHINALFREAKWLRNAVIGSGDPFSFDDSTKSVMVKVGDKFEQRDLVVISSQMKQGLFDSVKSEIGSLSTKKSKGEKVGKLKFKSYCNSIPLKQFDNTYRIDFGNNAIFIQNLRKPLKVRGLKQIPPDAEIANARFIRKASGLYFHITTYTEPVATDETGNELGIDFGIKYNMTFSNGEIRNISVPESKGTKLASKRLNKSQKRSEKHEARVKAKAKGKGNVKAKTKGGSKNKSKRKSRNHDKRKHKLRVAYEKTVNRKHDLANKQVYEILINNDFIGMQDEMIANWHRGLFGRQVQHSAMGYIKRKLSKSSKTQMVPRSCPSTQRCPECGRDTPHPLSKRDYDCSHCGYHHDSRDVKAACMNLMEGKRLALDKSLRMQTAN